MPGEAAHAPASPGSTTARAFDGRLDLHFARDGARTILHAAHRTPPLHLQRLLTLDPARPALVRAVLLNPTAGLCAGDRLHTRLTLDPGAAVEFTTPAQTRVFAMHSGHALTTTHLTVADGAYAEYLPEPTLLTRDAALDTRLELDAAPTARVAIGDVLALGRAARGELHAYRSLLATTELRIAGHTVLAERLACAPATDDADALFGAHAAYGALHLLGPGAADLLTPVRALLTAQPALLAGASLLIDGVGIAVRVLGPSAHRVTTALRAITGLFRDAQEPA